MAIMSKEAQGRVGCSIIVDFSIGLDYIQVGHSPSMGEQEDYVL